MLVIALRMVTPHSTRMGAELRAGPGVRCQTDSQPAYRRPEDQPRLGNAQYGTPSDAGRETPSWRREWHARTVAELMRKGSG